MSAFKELRDVSNNFECDLQEVSAELISAKIGLSFADSVEQKLKDLALLSAKHKLLEAIPLSYTQEVSKQASEGSLVEYGNTVLWKILEQTTVKSLSQVHAVKALLTTHDSHLDGQMLERKQDIRNALSHFKHVDDQLSGVKSALQEKETELCMIREKWDQTLGELRDAKKSSLLSDQIGLQGPLYEKLNAYVAKLEIMRWLLGRLACPRGAYDWIADPKKRLAVLPLTREYNTIELFTQ